MQGLRRKPQRRKSQIETSADKLAEMAGSSAETAQSIVTQGGVDSLIKTVKSRRSSNYEIGSSARAIAALASSGGDLLANEQETDSVIVESLTSVIKQRATEQLDNLEYFEEIKRRIDAGSATDDEKLEYEYRQLEITEKAEQEAARTEASYAIMSMATSADNIIKINHQGGVAAVMEAMKSNPRNKRHSLVTLDFIGQLAAEKLADSVVEVGGVESILLAMRTHKEDPQLQQKTMEALSLLATDEQNVQNMVQMGSVQLVTESLTKHMHVPSVVKSCVVMLSLLTLVEDGLDAISEEAATMDAVCEALFIQRHNEQLLEDDQVKEAVEALIPEDYVSPTLEEIYNATMDIKVEIKKKKKILRRSSVSLEAIAAVEAEAKIEFATPPSSPVKSDSQHQHDIKLSVLGLLKALHAMTVVPALTQLMEVNGGVYTLSYVLERVSLQLPDSLSTEIAQGCLLVMQHMGNEVGNTCLQMPEILNAFVTFLKAPRAARPSGTVVTVLQWIQDIFAEAEEQDKPEDFDAIMAEIRALPSLQPSWAELATINAAMPPRPGQ